MKYNMFVLIDDRIKEVQGTTSYLLVLLLL